MRIWHVRLLAVAASVALMIPGCGEDTKKPEPIRNDPFTGAWVGTWAVTTEVRWSGAGDCPSDTLMSTTIGILDGDHIQDVMERLAPADLAPYAHLLGCGMTLTGSEITFNCSFSGSDGACFYSTSNTGSGNADSNSFTLTADGSLNVQGPAAACETIHCSFTTVTNAQKVGAKDPAPGLTTATRGMRYN